MFFPVTYLVEDFVILTIRHCRRSQCNRRLATLRHLVRCEHQSVAIDSWRVNILHIQFQGTGIRPIAMGIDRIPIDIVFTDRQNNFVAIDTSGEIHESTVIDRIPICEISVRCAIVMERTDRSLQEVERVATMRPQRRHHDIAVRHRGSRIGQKDMADTRVQDRLHIATTFFEQPLQVVRHVHLEIRDVRQSHVSRLRLRLFLVIECRDQFLIHAMLAIRASGSGGIVARQVRPHLAPRLVFTDIQHQVVIVWTVDINTRAILHRIFDNAGGLIVRRVYRTPSDDGRTQIELMGDSGSVKGLILRPNLVV